MIHNLNSPPDNYYQQV